MSNLAYDYDYLEDEYTEEVKENEIKIEKKNVKKNNKSLRFLAKMYALTFVFTVVSLSLVLVDDTQVLSSVKNEIRYIKNEIREKERNISELNEKLQKIKNSSEIMEIAVNKLGMIPATSENEIHINEKESNIVKEGEKKSIFSAVFGGN